jgi:hypothetical protein
MNFTKGEKTNLKNPARNLIILAFLPLICLACSMFGGSSSPTVVYKAFIAAAMKKDTAAMKEYISEDALKSLKDAAKSSGKSEDELLKSFSENNDAPVDISNEKIAADGKTASLEIKTKSEDKKTIYFVKEGSWKITPDKPAEKTEETVETTPTDSTDSSKTSEPKETGPLTMSASDLLQDANNATSRMDSIYKDRMITITDGKLWDIQSNEIRIGSSTGSSGSIICEGSFSEYMPYSSKIGELSRQGKAPGASVKGMYSRIESNSGSPKVYLSPCVLSNLEKP